jgi:hypothetical protein
MIMNGLCVDAKVWYLQSSLLDSVYRIAVYRQSIAFMTSFFTAYNFAHVL